MGIEEHPESADAESRDHRDPVKLLRYWLNVARVIHTFISMAIDVLPSVDRELIIEEYGLEGIWHSYRADGPRHRSSADERQEALLRAKKRFSQGLEMMLAEAEKDLTDDRAIVKEALSIIRGDNVSNTIMLVLDIAGSSFP